ncbi:MAG: beta strand repeat-containing protein [bacterium]
MKIVRKSILVNLVLAVICGTSTPWPRSVKAEFAPLECVSGNCQIITQVQDTDLLKTFPASNTKVRLRLDTRNLVQANSTQETFSYRAYEINGSGQKEIISRTYVKFPTKAKNSKDYQVDLDIKPFIGTKKIYVEWFTSNDELALTNSFNVKATGSYANNQAESLSIGGSNVDKDAMIDFFVNNVKWTANTRGDAKAISVVPDQNTGTVEVNIPIIPSGLRAPLKRRQVSYTETGTTSETSGTPVTTGGNGLIDDAAFPLILENGNIMALTSSQDPSVPVLVITSNRRIGVNEDSPVATLDIAKGNNATALPIMKFEAGPLVSAPVNGAFEYDTAGDIYFTSNGVRKYFVLNPNSSSAVKKLESSSNPGKFLTLTGVNDVVLNGTAGVTLNLPSANGTIARLEDLGTLPASSVDASEIADGSVTNAKLATDAVTSNKILDGTVALIDLSNDSVNSSKIVNGSILPADLDPSVFSSFTVGTNSVTSSSIVDGTITSADLADGSVTNAKLATDAVTSNKILNGTVALIDLSNDSVNSSKIVNGSILPPDLDPSVFSSFTVADGSVTTPKLADRAVTSDKLGLKAVTAFNIADNAVSESKITPGAVTSNRILDGTIQTVDLDLAIITQNRLALDAVTSIKIADGTIDLVDLANDSVNSNKIVNASILREDLHPSVLSSLGSSSSIGEGSVTSTSILDSSIQTADLADASVTNSKIVSVDASKINGSVTNAKLATDAVTTDKILNGTITGADLASNTIVSGNISDGTIGLSDLSTAVLNTFDNTKLVSSSVGMLAIDAKITFEGLNNAVFQSNGANVNLLLPAGSGTLARLSDIGALGAGSVTTAALADGAVTNAKLAADAVTSNKIQDGTVTGADIADATITNADIAANTVNSGNILDGTIALIDLATDSVNSSKILNGSILPADLDPTVFSSFTPGAGSVTTTSILDGTILTADLADGSITNSKIVSVDASKITGTIPVTLITAKGVLASSVLDFAPDHSYFTRTMTANTTFTATNLKQGNRYVLKLSGAFMPTFPAYFVLNPERTYNPQLQNYFQFEVIDDSLVNPLVLVRLNQQPI